MHASPLRNRTFERILLIKPSAVGDVIHTVPVLAKLRTRYPAARIDWLLTPAIAELVGRHPSLSNALLFDRNTFARAWRTGRRPQAWPGWSRRSVAPATTWSSTFTDNSDPPF